MSICSNCWYWYCSIFFTFSFSFPFLYSTLPGNKNCCCILHANPNSIVSLQVLPLQLVMAMLPRSHLSRMLPSCRRALAAAASTPSSSSSPFSTSQANSGITDWFFSSVCSSKLLATLLKFLLPLPCRRLPAAPPTPASCPRDPPSTRSSRTRSGPSTGTST